MEKFVRWLMGLEGVNEHLSELKLMVQSFLDKKSQRKRLETHLHDHYDIDPDTGQVFCVKWVSGRKTAPKSEVWARKDGYVSVKIRGYNLGVSYIRRSHLVWWKATGKWPSQLIDHINGVKDDDRYINLRDVSPTDNNLNTRQSRDRRLPTYVHYNGRRYIYRRTHKGKLVNSRTHPTPELAASLGSKQWRAKCEELDKQ
jgi:hypothetical protein